MNTFLMFFFISLPQKFIDVVIIIIPFSHRSTDEDGLAKQTSDVTAIT